MAEKPIIFSGQMVKAILEGRKTQTRRVIKPQPERQGECGYAMDHVPAWYWTSPRFDSGFGVHYLHTNEDAAKRLMVTACPYGQPGGLLWVRETFATGPGNHAWGSLIYRASFGAPMKPICEGYTPWRPSIHMPRCASRITLEVTGVRVERVQEISEEDAIEEGICQRPVTIDDPKGSRDLFWNFETNKMELDDAVESFATLWDSLNKKRGHGWDVNPWCWCISFKRVEAARNG